MKRVIERPRTGRQWLLASIREFLAKLSDKERDQMAAELRLTPVFNIHL
jgi:hypothetical protein